MKEFKQAILLLFVLISSSALYADAQQVIKDIPYKSGDGLTAYEQERCKLDLYLPENAKDFPAMVWFHGGSIQTGDKAGGNFAEIAAVFTKQNIAVASANYRLSPKVQFPAYIEDCAASVAWVYRNIAKHGGDRNKVFVSGHSAGGYLSAMVGMDERYLEQNGLTVSQIAGFLPVSGQMITHSTVREERGIDGKKPIVDLAAPMFYVRKDTPPFLNIFGDNDLPARADENRLFVSCMKAVGNEHVEFQEFQNRNHGTIVSKMAEPNDPVAKAMIEFMKRNAK